MKRDLMIGKRFGKLTVLGDAGPLGRNQRSHVRCDCGVEKIVRDGDLRHGKINSCGCVRHGPSPNRTHNMSTSAEYHIWHDMKRRCYQPQNKEYKHYGACGITVCDRWLHSFENFFADMGFRPSKHHSVERKDNSLGYSPENCVWADTYQQANNRRSNIRIAFQGRTQNLVQWAREIGMNDETLRSRIERGWSIDEALTTPVSKAHSHN